MTVKLDVLDESPNESPDETEDCNDNTQIIHGAFIAAQPFKTKKAQDYHWIKLSTINSVEPIYDHDGGHMDYCHFKTYKDSKYLTWMNAHDLTKAINSFLFNSEQHLEKFNYE